MGNAIFQCCKRESSSSVKLIFQGGATRILTEKLVAGEVMFEFPDHMVCHADSFFIGQPIPALAIDDELIKAQIYFVLPIDYFPSNVLTASTLAALGNRPKSAAVSFKGCPFEYLKGSNGRVSIRVLPEFFIKLFTEGNENEGEDSDSPAGGSFLCSTPELQKHYNQLVGSKDQVWSPKLETISEYKIKYSPCRFIGLEWKQKEAGN
ncbi:Hypothetical predicted protein [Olea europaea subsp. europaea]|uniref:Uncharacterized protein n=1 Tax=Olea europaea subsp. europaea TaxID=158383 RepID=A0A8S0T2Z4_OLEEU|nr:Hypothetical predicted protein [Olea europaea subsp. europaea]